MYRGRSEFVFWQNSTFIFCIKTIRSKSIKKERMLPLECLNVVQLRECQ